MHYRKLMEVGKVLEGKQNNATAGKIFFYKYYYNMLSVIDGTRIPEFSSHKY